MTMAATLSGRILLGPCLYLALGPWLSVGAHTQGECQPDGFKREDLRTLLHRTRERNRPYQAPPLDELRKAVAAGRALLSAVRTERYQTAIPLFHQAHFEVVSTELGGAPAIAVCEESEHRRGGGIYVFRRGPVARERIVQVPHSFFDIGTLEIGIELASVGQARALFVNTVHRYEGKRPPARDEDESVDAPADLAHQELAFFQALTFAALSSLRHLQVVQVHGFAEGSVPECPSAAVVVSPGMARAGVAEAAQVTTRLAALLGPERVFLFPRDTRRLGARGNVQGRAAAMAGHATFLHLELSRSLRDRLNLDPGLRHAFAEAVVGCDGAAQ